VRIARNPGRLAAFERGLAEGGYEGAQRAVADAIVLEYEKSPPLQRIRGAMGIAQRYLDGGDKDRAIDWLYKSYADHDPNLLYIGGPFWSDPLHSDVRYQALLRRIGLPLDAYK
jgi:hypothetical protein